MGRGTSSQAVHSVVISIHTAAVSLLLRVWRHARLAHSPHALTMHIPTKTQNSACVAMHVQKSTCQSSVYRFISYLLPVAGVDCGTGRRYHGSGTTLPAAGQIERVSSSSLFPHLRHYQPGTQAQSFKRSCCSEWLSHCKQKSRAVSLRSVSASHSQSVPARKRKFRFCHIVRHDFPQVLLLSSLARPASDACSTLSSSARPTRRAAAGSVTSS